MSIDNEVGVIDLFAERINIADFKIAVKALIVNDGKLLILKRANNDIHKPGIWEIPGGRTLDDEEPEEALIRETKEETGLDIEVGREISVRDFTRDDKQEIEMHIFLCNATHGLNVNLSPEHTQYEWIELNKCKSKLTPFFHPEVDILLNLENEKWP